MLSPACICNNEMVGFKLVLKNGRTKELHFLITTLDSDCTNRTESASAGLDCHFAVTL